MPTIMAELAELRAQWMRETYPSDIEAWSTWTPKPTVSFTCRDIGYGVETGEVVAVPAGPRDWTGKRPYYDAHTGETLYLFDDEVDQ